MCCRCAAQSKKQLWALTCASRSDPITWPLPQHVLVVKAAGILATVSQRCHEVGDGEGSRRRETWGRYVGKMSLWSGDSKEEPGGMLLQMEWLEMSLASKVLQLGGV